MTLTDEVVKKVIIKLITGKDYRIEIIFNLTQMTHSGKDGIGSVRKTNKSLLLTLKRNSIC